MSQLPDWAELIAAFVDTFGPGVRVTNLRLASVPDWQLGTSVAEGVTRAGGYVEAYEHNQPGFGPEVETKTTQLPSGWKRHSDSVPRGTKQHTLLEEREITS